ncbi:MAG: hypothetical protein M3406_10290 [Chloroflexota bacterium]|nr:hypothetical protein [Chloroflexota bacterium]
MRVAAVITDLMLYSRIESAAIAAGASLIRVDTPADLPPDLDLVLVAWDERRDDWAGPLKRIGSRVILFGPHTDLSAHAAAKTLGLGPVWARSKLLTQFAAFRAAEQ